MVFVTVRVKIQVRMDAKPDYLFENHPETIKSKVFLLARLISSIWSFGIFELFQNRSQTILKDPGQNQIDIKRPLYMSAIVNLALERSILFCSGSLLELVNSFKKSH